MNYEPKKYDLLLGMTGFSDQLLKNHFTLYEGYVANTNKISVLLKEMTAAGKAATPEYAELKRRFGWEYNGMRLHELYFGNMAKDAKKLDQNSPLAKKITEEFGSMENWEADFKSTGTMRGIGWVILSHDTTTDTLFNVWINEHDVGHLAGATPILVLDVFEHAYMIDYGLKKADYITTFMSAVNWREAEKRFKA
ncbi:MAG: superoxide dismutase [bacterium]|nr:superoxide dismutase [bacterium]